MEYKSKRITQIFASGIQVSLNVVKGLQYVDGFLDADARVQDVVLAVVGSQQLVDDRRSHWSYETN